MVRAKFVQLARSERWRPIFLGCLLSLPLMAVLAVLRRYCFDLVACWFFLYLAFGGLGVFRRTPVRKLLSTAAAVGTFASFLF